MSNQSKKNDLPKDIVREILKYVVIGLLGAAISYSITLYDRFPSHALTVLPAGVHLMQGPALTCADTQFISETLNTFLTNEIRLPQCDVLLGTSVVTSLRADLDRAKATWKTERLGYLTPALAKLKALKKSPSDASLQHNVLAVLSDLTFLYRNAPRDLSGPDLLDWSIHNVGTAVDDLTRDVKEIERIQAILDSKDAGHLQSHLEVYFVLTNASDIAFYFPTHCSLAVEQLEIPLIAEQVDNEVVPVSSLAYLPILPSRGRLVRFAPVFSHRPEVDSLIHNLTEPSLALPAGLACTLTDKKNLQSPAFKLRDFLVIESKPQN